MNLEYLDIIVTGILKNESELKSYFEKKQKEAEIKNLVSEKDFFQNCSETILLIENNFQTEYIEKKRELIQRIELLKIKKEPFEKEIELVSNFSIDRFNASIADITNQKYNGKLWLNQINQVKNCITEIINQNFKFTIEFKDLNVDNYLEFVFSQKSIGRKTKKNAVQKLIDESKQDKSIANYKIWIDYVFNQQNYWVEIKQDEKKLFDELRTKSFEKMTTLFENLIKSSPKTRITLEKEFETAIVKRLNEEPYRKTTFEFTEGLLPQNLNNLAIIIGKIDFIKKLYGPINNEIIESIDLRKLTLNEIGLKCFYEGKQISRENANIELIGTELNSSEKLYSHFSKWSSKIERRAKPDSKVKLLNKIKIFEHVIKALPSDKKELAILEFNVLQEYLNNY